MSRLSYRMNNDFGVILIGYTSNSLEWSRYAADRYGKECGIYVTPRGSNLALLHARGNDKEFVSCVVDDLLKDRRIEEANISPEDLEEFLLTEMFGVKYEKG